VVYPTALVHFTLFIVYAETSGYVVGYFFTFCFFFPSNLNLCCMFVRFIGFLTQVHVHSPRVSGAAVTDAAAATLSARHHEAALQRDASAGLGGNPRDVRRLAGQGQSQHGAPMLSFARLSAADAGVTARLDVVDESALPALLVYRGGSLIASRCNVCLPSAHDRLLAREEACDKREHMGDTSRSPDAIADCVSADDDLEVLADELEDLLDELGLYD